MSSKPENNRWCQRKSGFGKGKLQSRFCHLLCEAATCQQPKLLELSHVYPQARAWQSHQGASSIAGGCGRTTFPLEASACHLPIMTLKTLKEHFGM